ncbi:MAG: hypothetical protein K2Q26_05505 [Bdellovibrionales bacterium]|nr:hypothetical protein [Bdellovibrionales bacterium]
MQKKKAIEFINQEGILLVFPIKNAKEPLSLWSQFYPRKEMRWEWSEDGDDHVAELWHLMKELSARTDIVYGKWFRGRATFFSREVFTALLKILKTTEIEEQGIPRTAAQILETLKSNSPISTRDIKKEHDLQGRDNEPEFNRAMKYLFSRLLIVGHGEVDDGAFPSLAVGATSLLFEDLWREAKELSEASALKTFHRHFEEKSLMQKFVKNLLLIPR